MHLVAVVSRKPQHVDIPFWDIYLSLSVNFSHSQRKKK